MKIELPWNGQPLDASVIAFDTETVSTCDLSREIPELVVLTASDGDRTVVVFPDAVPDFYGAHCHKDWVAWNVAFDWWVLHQSLPHWQNNLELWTDQGHYHDAMLLEQLVRLAEGRDGEGFFNRPLGGAAQEYLGRRLTAEKKAIRMAFTPDMARDWQNVDRKYWEYAAEDAQVTFELWEHLKARADAAVSSLPPNVRAPEGVDLPDCAGTLSEQIQVRAAIVLAKVTRNGMAVDSPAVAAKVAEYTGKCEQSLADMLSQVPTAIKRRKKDQAIIRTKKTGMPQFSNVAIRNRLLLVAETEGLTPPHTPKTDQVVISADWWQAHSDKDPFVAAWVAYQDSVKVLQLLKSLEGRGHVHPRYRTLVRSGRTSATDPNIQQAPRDGWYRSLFVARPGHRLTAVDYSFIELSTLASEMEYRYGHSRLADVIRAGVDPHIYTAALFVGLEHNEFMLLKAASPAKFKSDRQAAKAINFGIPGGLGARGLQNYAKHNYGVTVSLEQAKALRNKLIHEVYPELERWLADGLAERLAITLDIPREQVLPLFSGDDAPFMDPLDHPMARVVAGETYKKGGVPFSPFYVEEVWVRLEHLLGCSRGAYPEWVGSAIRERRPDTYLAAYLFAVPCVTLTGRVRGETRYGEYRNTKFQGLAADGAKIALWALMTDPRLSACRTVAFVHDEIVVESPLEMEESYVERTVGDIMVRAFDYIHPTRVPVGVSSASGPSWTKS